MQDSFITFVQAYPVVFAGVFGIIPAIIWLWFWLKEDIHPEPTKFIIFSFLAGMLSVFVALLAEQLAKGLTSDETLLFLLWATIEELLKFGAAWIGGMHTSADDEPIDPVIYMIVAALGFVAMENTLFLVDPLVSGHISDTLIAGDLRFIGAALLHVISSSTIGIFYALSLNKSKKRKIVYIISGVILAIILHTTFNLFIIDGVTGGIFVTFGLVWASIAFLMLILEKVKTLTI